MSRTHPAYPPRDGFIPRYILTFAPVNRPLTALTADIMKTLKVKEIVRDVTLDGMMTFSQFENGMRAAQFECCEDVCMEPFSTRCKVQAMRDGNVYITELPRRMRNKALYREDNCSLSLGHDGRYHFVFSLPQEMANELPQRLVRQASAIARKVMMDIIGNY